MKIKTFKIISILAFVAIFLSACSKKNNEGTSSSVSRPSKISLSSSSSAETTNSSSTAEINIADLLGSWVNGNKTLHFSEDGSYTFINGQTFAGTYAIGAAYDNTLLVKISNFNAHTPGLDSYTYVTKNKDGSINFGNFGTFKPSGTINTLVPSLYLADYLRSAPDTADQIVVGTWSNNGSSNHTYITYNFNPDRTVERFSDGSGMVSKGHYSLTAKGETFYITFNFAGQEPQTTTFKMSDNYTKMTQSESGITMAFVKNDYPKGK